MVDGEIAGQSEDRQRHELQGVELAQQQQGSEDDAGENQGVGANPNVDNQECRAPESQVALENQVQSDGSDGGRQAVGSSPS